MTGFLRIQGSAAPLRGACDVPGDKSISHRAVLLGALAKGVSRVDGFLRAGDCEASLRVMRDLGVRLEAREESLLVHGVGLGGLTPPSNPLDCGNSGTTMRLLAGLLAGQNFDSTLTGTPQLQRRPMDRVIHPLQSMGAAISGRDEDRFAPICIRAGHLEGVIHEMGVPSAQVKSALLLAGLYAKGPTTIVEKGPCRDHTERMLQAMGVQVQREGNRVTLWPPRALEPLNSKMVGDLSSAAFLVAGAVALPDSDILLKGVGLNPTRLGFIDALRAMGACIDVQQEGEEVGEPVGRLRMKCAPLVGATFGGDDIVRMIDEIPLLALVATQARGITVISDLEELRIKETDRLATTAFELKKLGAQVESRSRGLVIHGPNPLMGTDVFGHGDHRIAMMLMVAGLLARGETRVHGVEVTGDSFPGYEDTLVQLGAVLG